MQSFSRAVLRAAAHPSPLARSSALISKTTPAGFVAARYFGDDGYQPRDRGSYNNDRQGSYGGDRGGYQPRGRGGYGGDRGGYGGGRGGYGGDRGGDRGGYGGGRDGEYGGRGGGRGGGMSRGGGRGGFGGRDRPPFENRVMTPTNSVYVGNLLFDATAKDLEEHFASVAANIKNVKIAEDPRGLSKGFGYIEFETVDDATKAIEAMNQTVLEGRRLIVNYMNTTRRETRESPPSKTLFIGNLAFEMSDADLNKLFRDIANVIDVRVAIDRRTGQPRGFAHADFVDVESASKARDALRQKEVYGRILRVDFSTGGRDGGAPLSERSSDTQESIEEAPAETQAEATDAEGNDRPTN